MKYDIKCDNCKKTIGTTDSLRESVEGGICGQCKDNGGEITEGDD